VLDRQDNLGADAEALFAQDAVDVSITEPSRLFSTGRMMRSTRSAIRALRTSAWLSNGTRVALGS
jgi:hypothetical protein